MIAGKREAANEARAVHTLFPGFVFRNHFRFAAVVVAFTSSSSKSTCRRGRAMNHSLIDADGNTHVKIAAVALVASVVFMAVVSMSGLPRWDSVAVHGPVVKATPT